ncbi:MAG TPA: hypothetical protein VFY49_05340 [Myxococcota bacterium]|nr:hypothetical protein [Myxococcota bacterium]
MQLRRMLYALVVIVAAVSAGTWISSRAPRKIPAPRPEVASAERAADSAEPPHAVQPRRGAGTVGARAGSLGAVAAPGEYNDAASQHGDAGESASFGRAPSDVAWSGRGVEGIAPPTPGRDPSDSEPTQESPPPDPTTIASSGFAAGLAPQAEAPATRAPSEPAPGSDEGVPNRGPLSEAEIAALVDHSLPPEVQKIEADRIRTNSNVAADFTH